MVPTAGVYQATLTANTLLGPESTSVSGVMSLVIQTDQYVQPIYTDAFSLTAPSPIIGEFQWLAEGADTVTVVNNTLNQVLYLPSQSPQVNNTLGGQSSAFTNGDTITVTIPAGAVLFYGSTAILAIQYVYGFSNKCMSTLWWTIMATTTSA